VRVASMQLVSYVRGESVRICGPSADWEFDVVAVTERYGRCMVPCTVWKMLQDLEIIRVRKQGNLPPRESEPSRARTCHTRPLSNTRSAALASEHLPAQAYNFGGQIHGSHLTARLYAMAMPERETELALARVHPRGPRTTTDLCANPLTAPVPTPRSLLHRRRLITACPRAAAARH
jgi:hypothetical protein